MKHTQKSFQLTDKRRQSLKELLLNPPEASDKATSFSSWFNDLWTDTRFALRQLIKGKLHSMLLIVIIALCLGPNGAFFSFFYYALWNSTIYPEASQLVDTVGNLGK